MGCRDGSENTICWHNLRTCVRGPAGFAGTRWCQCGVNPRARRKPVTPPGQLDAWSDVGQCEAWNEGVTHLVVRGLILCGYGLVPH